MQVIIDEIVSSIRVLDGEALLAPQTLDKIVCAVLQAVDEKEMHSRRVRAELCILSSSEQLAGEEA